MQFEKNCLQKNSLFRIKICQIVKFKIIARSWLRAFWKNY